MKRSAAALFVGACLVAGGCAHQPYPPLPQDVLAQPRSANAAPSSPTVGAGSALPGAGVASLDDQFGDASRVSEVARREARLPPVSQEVSPPPPDPDSLPPAGSRRLDLLLGPQTFRYFEDDRLVWSGRISSGVAEHPTPTGHFRVLAKNINKRSGSYTNFFDQPTPMPYAMQFNGPYWVHEGYVPQEPASHGCVRLRYEDARFLYARLRIGDPVHVLE